MPGETGDAATLEDLIEACSKIVRFMEGVAESDFYGDELLVSAINFQISILGEAVKRLSMELRTRYSDVPWQRIAGMRDRLIHGYDDIDFLEVWKTATMNVPRLMEQLRQIQADRKL